MNKYQELKKKQASELNKLPMKFAFSNEQFKKGMEELGLTEKDVEKVCGIGAGGFMKKEDVGSLHSMWKRHDEERKQAMDDDQDGSGYILDMFYYEMCNHEYGYTYDLTDTLNALGLTLAKIENDVKLKNGLMLAKKKIQDVDYGDFKI